MIMAATCVIYRLRWHDGGKWGNKIFNITKLGKLKWCEGVRGGKSIELDLVNVMKGERRKITQFFVRQRRKNRKTHKYLKMLLIESFSVDFLCQLLKVELRPVAVSKKTTGASEYRSIVIQHQIMGLWDMSFARHFSLNKYFSSIFLF